MPQRQSIDLPGEEMPLQPMEGLEETTVRAGISCTLMEETTVKAGISLQPVDRTRLEQADIA